jgi:hypothetical protein
MAKFRLLANGQNGALTALTEGQKKSKCVDLGPFFASTRKFQSCGGSPKFRKPENPKTRNSESNSDRSRLFGAPDMGEIAIFIPHGKRSHLPAHEFGHSAFDWLEGFHFSHVIKTFARHYGRSRKFPYFCPEFSFWFRPNLVSPDSGSPVSSESERGDPHADYRSFNIVGMHHREWSRDPGKHFRPEAGSMEECGSSPSTRVHFET